MPITKKQTIAAAAVVIMLAAYAIIGFYLLPELVRRQLPILLAEKTGQKVQLQAVRLNPFSFDLELDGFSLSESDGELFGFEHFIVHFNAYTSLRQQALVFNNIALHKPIINIKRLADGHFNFSRLLPNQQTKTSEDRQNSQMLPLTIQNLAITEGHFDWLDEASGQPQHETVLPLNLSVINLSTQNIPAGTFDLTFSLASGGHLQWQGELNLNTLSSKGHIRLEQLDLAKVWRLFFQKLLPVDIATGNLSLQSEYQAGFAENKPQLLINNADIEIKKLEITEKAQKDPLLSFPAITIRGISANLDKHEVNLTELVSSDAQIKANLLQDGRLNYQVLFAKQAPEAEAEPAPQSSPTVAKPGWQIGLQELVLHNYQLQFIDQTQVNPQPMKLSSINFNLRKFSTQNVERLPVQFSALFNEVGKLNITGDIGLAPLNAALTIDIKNIKLKNFHSYLDDYLALEWIDGDFNTLGNLQVQLADKLQLNFKGDANFANLLTRDKVKHKDFLKWADLQLQQINVDLAKQLFTLDTVLFDRPYLRVNIKKDRSTNISDIPVVQPAKPAAAAKTDQNKTDKMQIEPTVEIGKIAIKDGHSDFADNSLILPFVADMTDLNGEAQGFSLNQNSNIKLTLAGKVYNIALVTIKGDYQLKSGDSNIGLKFTHLPLPLITPYMADFAGYKIEKGQMALDLQYQIKQGQLEAQNKIFIDQLTLGEQVDNPKASSLPLNLAIALLKDADGKINLDFPITGSLNDPQFSIGSLIADVLSNLVEKLVESPFKALGGLLSESDSDYSSISFAAGKAELKPEETAKLDTLGKALQNKAELMLDIKGVASQSLDWPELRFEAVVEILKKMKSGELRDKGEKIRSEYITLSDDEYKRLLAKFFKEVFPQEIDTGLLGAPRIKAQPDADFYTIARQKLELIMPPDPQRLNDLAIARANAISSYLSEKTGLDLNRIYLLAPELDTDGSKGSLSILSLNTRH